MNAPRNLISRAPMRPGAAPRAANHDSVLQAVIAALAGMTDKHLQEQVEEACERADALQAQLDASNQAIAAMRAELTACTAQMSAMASQHVADMREAEDRHCAAIASLGATAAAPDLTPVLHQVQTSVAQSLAAITETMGHMDMRIKVMAQELAAMPAPPTELEFDVLDDGAGGNLRIIARSKR